MALTVDGALQRFKTTWNLADDQCVDLRAQLAVALECGSDDRKQEQIDEIYRIASETGFLKISRIGGGTFGEVYKGIDLNTKELVAIKVIDLDETKDDILIIRREIVALVGGSNCKQLVAYKGTRVIDTNLWIVMEFVKGGSLGDRIKKRRYTERETAIIAREMLLGLQHLHSEDRIHRDVKAANVLIQEDGQVKLGDLGASAQLTVTKPSADTMIGSPYWMAPEVMRHQKHDGKADVWSLGITCIELVHGKPPLSELNPLQIVMRVPNNDAPKLEGDFSKEFKEFVSTCLQKDPASRPTVKELLDHTFIKSAGEVSELVPTLQ